MGPTASLLDRRSLLNSPSLSSSADSLTPIQSQVDGLVGSFVQQATDWRSLAAMTAGGMTYRLGRMGALAAGTGRIASLGIGLGAEVTAFEMSHRSLSSLTGDTQSNPNLWRWEGQGGIRQGLLSSLVTFGTLKGAGRLAQGENVVIQHLLQDTGMVLGHQVSASFGIMDRPQGTLAEQFLHAEATNLQLGAGMSLTHGVTPGIQGLERGLDLSLRSTDVGARPGEETLPLQIGLQPAFAIAGEDSGAIPEPSPAEPKGPTILMMNDVANKPGTEKTGGRTVSAPPYIPSVPVPSSFPEPPTPTPTGGGGSRRSSGGTRKWIGRGMALVTSFGRWFNVNAFFNPEDPLPQSPTAPQAPPVRSVQEGIDRARINGHSRRTLAFLRWGAHQLREQPEAQERFLNLMDRVFRFQAERREEWDTILKGLPNVDSRDVNEKAEKYHQALAALTPGSGRLYAEAVLMNEQTRPLTSEQSFLELTEANLLEMGIDPNALISLRRNAHAFTERELLDRLAHPLLRDRPETAALREAVQTHHRERTALEQTISSLQKRAKELRDQIAKTPDAAERKRLERLIREEAEGAQVNRSYEESVDRLNEQMSRFLSDPLRANIFLVENARQTALARGLQDLNREEMTRYVRGHLESLTGDARSAAESLLYRSQEYDLVSNRGPLGRLFFGVARFINLDPHSPMAVRGRYEQALIRLIQETSPDFWTLEVPSSPEALEAARSAQREYQLAYDRWSEELRDALAPLEEANNNFWRRYDADVIPLYVEDLKLQVAQAVDHIERAREKLDNRFGPLAPGFEALILNTEAAIEKLNDPALTLRSSRSFNRCLEAALEKAHELRNFARKALRQAKLPGRDFKPVSALMLPYAEKKDSHWLFTRLGESVAASLPVVVHTVPAVGRLASTVKRGESVAMTDRIYEKWAVEMGGRHWFSRLLGTRHLYRNDENVDHLVENDSLVIPGNHNGWPDFARGPTPGVRAAQLQGRDTHRDAIRILAKQGLGKLVGPLFEDAIDLLTESVGDSTPEYDGSVTRAARAMAFGDLPSGRLGPRSAAAYDELTMSVASLVNPYAFDPYPTISSILRIPQGGRSFNIADRALALTGRSQNLLLTTTLNSYRIYPKPDRPWPLRRGELTTVSKFMPHLALTTPEADAKNGPGETRANWLRTYWLAMATTPEHDHSVPSIDRTFRPFQKPGDPIIEEILQNMFVGGLDVYPNGEEAARLRGRVENLRAELERARSTQADGTEAPGLETLERELASAERAHDLYDASVVQIRLRQAMAELRTEENRPHAPYYPGIRRYRQALRGRLKDMAKIEEALQEGRELSPRQADRWHRLRTSYVGDETNGYTSRIQRHLALLREVENRPHEADVDPLLEEMQARQAAYLNHLDRIAHAERGEEPGASLEELEADRFRLEQPYRDAVEAYYFLKGHMPSGWDLGVARADRPSTWLNGALLSGLQFFLRTTGVEPPSWDGAVFSSVRRRWENGTLVIEPVNPRPETGLSKRALYSILLETIRLQLATVKTVGIDPEGRNFDGIVPAWLYSILGQAGTTIRVEGLENLRGHRDENLITVWTHRGMSEYAMMLGVQDHFGHPLRILADEKFRKNPVIRGLVGLAMESYNFFFIDRSSTQKSRETMGRIGEQLKTGIAGIALFPGMSRTPTMVFDGERVEGPLYQNRAGVGSTARAAGDPWIVPVALIGTGKMTPSSFSEQRRGIPMGETVTLRIGKPFLSSEVLQPITSPNPKRRDLEALQQDRDLALRIDREFAGLTDLPTGPLYASKPKSIFQVDDPEDLRQQTSQRLSPEWTWKILSLRSWKKGLSNLIPRRETPTYKDSAAVFPPSLVRSPELDGQISGILSELNLPQGRQLTVFYTHREEDGVYRFTPVHYRRRKGEKGIEIVEGRLPQ